MLPFEFGEIYSKKKGGEKWVAANGLTKIAQLQQYTNINKTITREVLRRGRARSPSVFLVGWCCEDDGELHRRYGDEVMLRQRCGDDEAKTPRRCVKGVAARRQ